MRVAQMEAKTCESRGTMAGVGVSQVRLAEERDSGTRLLSGIRTKPRWCEWQLLFLDRDRVRETQCLVRKTRRMARKRAVRDGKVEDVSL